MTSDPTSPASTPGPEHRTAQRPGTGRTTPAARLPPHLPSRASVPSGET